MVYNSILNSLETTNNSYAIIFYTLQFLVSMYFHISLLLFCFIVVVNHTKNGLYVANCFGNFCCISKLGKVCYFCFPSEATPASIFILWLFSDICVNF